MLCYYYIMAIPRYVILHRGITASGDQNHRIMLLASRDSPAETRNRHCLILILSKYFYQRIITRLQAPEERRSYKTNVKRHRRPEPVRGQEGHHRTRENDHHAPDARPHVLRVELVIFEVLLIWRVVGRAERSQKIRSISFHARRGGLLHGQKGATFIGYYSYSHSRVDCFLLGVQYRSI